jgi:sugar lactone lactonase YvrE
MNRYSVFLQLGRVSALAVALVAVFLVGQPGCVPPPGLGAMGERGPEAIGGNVTPTGELAASFSVIHGPRAVEDLAFDYDGYLLGAQNGNLFRTAYGGQPELIVAGAGASGGPMSMITGIMVLGNHDILYCDTGSGTLFRADSSGAKRAVLSGLRYPNGLEMDPNGLIYLAENQANAVRRINVETGEFTTVVSDVPSPDGVTFNPTYTTLYISSATMMGNSTVGKVYAVDIDASGQPGQLRVFASGLPAHLNALTVDVNGNVYVAAVGEGEIWRLTPDGQERTLLVKVNDLLATVQWGSGIGGWDSKTLYMSNRKEEDLVYALNVGIEGKHRFYP